MVLEGTLIDDALEGTLVEKLRKLEALHAGTKIDGEREAARRAAERIRERLAELRGREQDVELLYSLPDPWTRKLFTALCRRYGLTPFRERGRRRSTLQVRAPKTFHERTLWPEFLALSKELKVHLEELTERVIREAIHDDVTEKWLAAGVLEDGKWSSTNEGTPQGATISPLLANVYLHYVFDLWVQQWRKRVARGEVIVVRYADDFVLGFQHEADAVRFRADLHERLERFGLEVHPDKTRLIRFGSHARIPCTKPRPRRATRDAAGSRAWRRDQSDDDYCSAGGGTVTRPIGSLSSASSRRPRVVVQYLGASSRYRSRGQYGMTRMMSAR